jgi:hypothetical protein
MQANMASGSRQMLFGVSTLPAERCGSYAEKLIRTAAKQTEDFSKTPPVPRFPEKISPIQLRPGRVYATLEKAA